MTTTEQVERIKTMLAATRASMVRLPSAVVIQFKTYEDDLTMDKRLEAKAIDPDTELPVVSLPLSDMHDWLKANGFRWLSGSSGVWERSAAA